MLVVEIRGPPLVSLSEFKNPTGKRHVSVRADLVGGKAWRFSGIVLTPLRQRRECEGQRCNLHLPGVRYTVPARIVTPWQSRRPITWAQLENLAGRATLPKPRGGVSLAKTRSLVSWPGGRASWARDGIMVACPGGSLSLAGDETLCSALATLDTGAALSAERGEEAFDGAQDEDLLLEVLKGDTESLPQKELTRRSRISAANSGKVPWNKGRKWSPEVRAKIQARTKAIMNDPQMREKMRQMNYYSRLKKPLNDEAREKIRMAMLALADARRTTAEAHQANLQEWKAAIAGLARMGLPGDKELEWRGPRTIAEVGEPQRKPAKKKVKRAKVVTQLAQGEGAGGDAVRDQGTGEPRAEGVGSRGSRSEAHRAKIAAAVRAKWLDPEYRAKVSAGMTRVMSERPRVKKESTPRVPKPPAEKKPRKARMPKASSASKDAQPDSANGDATKFTADPFFVAAVMADGESGAKKTRIRKVRIIDRLDGGKLGDAEGRPREDRAAETLAPLREESLDQAEALDHNLAAMDGGDEVLEATPIEGLLEGILRVHEERRVGEEKRKELTGRARMLMEEAERATKALESAADLDEHSRAALAEARLLLDEAARSIQVAEMDHRSSPNGSLSLEQLLHGPFLGPDGREEPSHRTLFRAARMGEGTPQEQADRLRLLAECFGLTLYEFSQAGGMGNFEAAHQALVKEARLLRLGKGGQTVEPLDANQLAGSHGDLDLMQSASSAMRQKSISVTPANGMEGIYSFMADHPETQEALRVNDFGKGRGSLQTSEGWRGRKVEEGRDGVPQGRGGLKLDRRGGEDEEQEWRGGSGEPESVGFQQQEEPGEQMSQGEAIAVEGSESLTSSRRLKSSKARTGTRSLKQLNDVDVQNVRRFDLNLSVPSGRAELDDEFARGVRASGLELLRGGLAREDGPTVVETHVGSKRGSRRRIALRAGKVETEEVGVDLQTGRGEGGSDVEQGGALAKKEVKRWHRGRLVLVATEDED